MMSNESPAVPAHDSPARSGAGSVAPAARYSPALPEGGPAAQGWAPDACTLPTAQRPLRGAEFRAAFADLVRSAERTEPTRLRLDLARTAQAAGRIAELAVRETECCSFFAFELGVTASALTLDITVPPAYVPVLDALAAAAEPVQT